MCRLDSFESVEESATGQKSRSRLRLRVTATAEKLLRCGHPWVFSESVREQNRPGDLGELAVVYDRKDQFLAVGLFDPESPIRLRVLHTGKPEQISRRWWALRLSNAFDRRSGLLDERTTGYRLINGESDGWPGLVLDRYDRTLVLKLYTTAWLPRLDEICDLVDEQAQPDRIVLRLSRNIQGLAKRSFSRDDGMVLRGTSLSGSVIFLEAGLKFEADVLKGQKTGFFLDQRENRKRVEALAVGRAVLNAFSFSGGFSLCAARGGASSVTDLDISAHALRSAARNFALNQSIARIAACPHQGVQADAFEWLEGNASRMFRLIILDPPSLAKKASEKPGAIRAYRRLVKSATAHLLPDGIMVACSCSAHLTADEFFTAVRTSARETGRTFAELETSFHAPDHPAAFKEAQYLKAIYLRT